MNNFTNKYHSALEVKSIVSFFLRHLKSIENYTNSEETIKNKLDVAKKECEELLSFVDKIVIEERPDELIMENQDRGIDSFLEGSNCCGGNDGGSGGGGGNCGP